MIIQTAEVEKTIIGKSQIFYGKLTIWILFIEIGQTFGQGVGIIFISS